MIRAMGKSILTVASGKKASYPSSLKRRRRRRRAGESSGGGAHFSSLGLHRGPGLLAFAL